MSPLYARILISSAAILVLIIRHKRPEFLTSDQVTLGLLIVGVLPWAGYLIESAELPGGWSFRFRELEKKADKLEGAAVKLQAEAEKLHVEAEKTRLRIDKLLIASMSMLAVKNLQKIASGNFGSFYRGQGLTWQLLFFASIGYISFKCRGIDEIPVNGEEPAKLNLSDYVQITDNGLEYLSLRDVVEKRRLDANV